MKTIQIVSGTYPIETVYVNGMPVETLRLNSPDYTQLLRAAFACAFFRFPTHDEERRLICNRELLQLKPSPEPKCDDPDPDPWDMRAGRGW